MRELPRHRQPSSVRERQHCHGGCGVLGGFQPAIMRTHSQAYRLSVTPGNSRRSSTTADRSPRCSKTARIAAA